MAEIILIMLSVTIMSRYRKANEKGGGKYVLAIWLTWLASIIIGGVVGTSTGSQGGIYAVVIIGYVICFVIAANGMRSGKQYQENYEASRRREEDKRQEARMEKEIQARVNAAVASALAKERAATASLIPETAPAPVPAYTPPIPEAKPVPAPDAPPPPSYVPAHAAPAPVAVTSAAPATSKTSDTFYVFAAQGPAFGSGFTGDIAMEKAQKLKADYAPARSMDLRLIRPNEWSSPVSASSSGGIISASFSLDDHRSEIERYLQKLGVPSQKIQRGLQESKEHSLQLMNPMSGLFVMGVPIQ